MITNIETIIIATASITADYTYDYSTSESDAIDASEATII